jgi:hypothetical protein
MRPWDRHPPWAHWGFYVVWGIAGTLGPILLFTSLLSQPSDWWIGAALCGVWIATLGLDWLVVRRFRATVEGWTPWEPKWGWLRK